MVGYTNELALAIDKLIQEEANRQKAEMLDRLYEKATDKMYPNGIENDIEAERKKLEEGLC